MKALALTDIGALVCHQIDERTLRIGGELLPLCARCTGLYAGFLVGSLTCLTAGRASVDRSSALSLKTVAVAAIFLALTVLEAAGERGQLWDSTNTGRLLLGLLGGGAIAVLLVSLCHYFAFPHVTIRATTASRCSAEFVVVATAGFFLYEALGAPLFFSLFSMAGLFALYLCVNLAVSGAVLATRSGNSRKGSVYYLLGVVLLLFIGEGVLFSLIQSRNQIMQ